MVIILVKFLYTEIFCIVYWDTKLKRQNTKVKNITRQHTQKFGTAALIKFHFHLKTFASYFVIKIFSPWILFKLALHGAELACPAASWRPRKGPHGVPRRWPDPQDPKRSGPRALRVVTARIRQPCRSEMRAICWQRMRGVGLHGAELALPMAHGAELALPMLCPVYSLVKMILLVTQALIHN